MEMGRAETQEKTPLSELLAREDRLGPERDRVHQVLLHFLHVAYIMGGEEVPYQTPRRCPKSWQVCCGHLCGQWLGNEAMYQTRRPGCLALTLVKGGATEASVGVGFCNSFEHPRESEKLRKACQNFLRIFVCIWQR